MAAQSADCHVGEVARSWAQLGRANLAGSHADLVETIITLEEQLATFTTSMDMLTADCNRLWEGCLENSFLAKKLFYVQFFSSSFYTIIPVLVILYELVPNNAN